MGPGKRDLSPPKADNINTKEATDGVQAGPGTVTWRPTGVRETLGDRCREEAPPLSPPSRPVFLLRTSDSPCPSRLPLPEDRPP